MWTGDRESEVPRSRGHAMNHRKGFECYGLITTVMRILNWILLALVLAHAVPFLGAQERDATPTVDVLYPKYALESEPCVLTEQHIGNMKSYVFQRGPSVMDFAVLQNGKYSVLRTPESGPASVELAWLRQPPRQPSVAIVLYDWEWVGGSSSQSNVVQVFGCRDRHLTILQQITNDAHSVHAGADYDAETGVLTVKSVNYGAGAHCCPEKLDIVTFKWFENGFEQVEWKTVPMPK